MKAITIKQPWATLIALGLKKYETRGWKTKYRGRLAIHAGKEVDKKAFQTYFVKNALAEHGIHSVEQLATSAVLATVDIQECHHVKVDYMELSDIPESETDTGIFIKSDEWWFGDFSEGRYAWELTNIEVLPEPIAAKGQLRLWEWSNPSEDN